MAERWPTKQLSAVRLMLDRKNPRLGREFLSETPREILQYLFDHDKAIDVARSIALRGYFPNEPLLAIKENEKYIVVEGNRRLAAIKALREPGLVEGRHRRAIERFSKQVANPSDLDRIPVTIAPSRRATDRQVAGRHIGSAVLPWQAENRASFILDKLAEGYSNDQIRDDLGFTLSDIQKARQTRAIAEMARSLELPDEVRAKVANPRAKLFTTIERVFESTAGKDFFMVVADPDHGIRGITTKKQFLLGFRKLVTAIALGKVSSRTLNKRDDIEDYLGSWPESDKPQKKQGSFVPADIIGGMSVASQPSTSPPRRPPQRAPSKTVLPRDFKVRVGHERLMEIRDELVKLKRKDFSNAGAVLLRVFFELAVIDYLHRTNRMEPIVEKLKGKGDTLPFGTPQLGQVRKDVIRLAKEKLPKNKATMVERAVRQDRAAPFGLDSLHAFVHQPEEFPGENDIRQFWNRVEPLLRFMLEQDQVDQ